MDLEEVTVDRKGRVQLHKAVRDKVELRVGEKLKIKSENKDIVNKILNCLSLYPLICG